MRQSPISWLLWPASSPKRLVCVRPPSQPLAPLEEECEFFLSRLRSTSPAGSLPALSDDPYLEIPPSLDAVSSRMKFLWNALNWSSSLTVTNPFGLLKPRARAGRPRAFVPNGGDRAGHKP